MKTLVVNAINALINGASVESMNAVATSMNVNVSADAEAAIAEELLTNRSKYVRMAKEQRCKALVKLINGAVAKYPVVENTASDVVVLAATVKHRGKPARPVYKFDKDGNFIEGYESVQAAHRASGVSDASICYCCLGKPGFKTAGGFKWSYENKA